MVCLFNWLVYLLRGVIFLYCINCGNMLDEGAKFCSNCGKEVDDVSSDFKVSSPLDFNNSDKRSYKFIIILFCFVSVFLVVLFICFLFCRRSSDIESAFRNMINYSGFDINVDASTFYNGEQVDLGLSVDSIVDSNMLSGLVNVSISGVSFDIPIYVDDGVLYLKFPTDNKWYKLSVNDYVSFDFFDLFSDDGFVESVGSDIDKTDKYVLHFTRSILQRFCSDNGLDFSKLDEVGFGTGFDVFVYVNSKGNYVSKLCFDLSGMSFRDLVFDKLVFSIDVSDIGDNSVVIPSQVMSAIDFSSLFVDDDFMLSYGNYVISYVLPSNTNFKESNSSYFKTYDRDGLSVSMSIDLSSLDSFFNSVGDMSSALDLGYTDVNLGDIMEFSYNDKVFHYRDLSYTTANGVKVYEVYLCYLLDDGYIYSIVFSSNDVIGDDSMRDFLNFNVNKTTN